jgi:hypothetical protein
MAYAPPQLDGRTPPDPMHEVRFKCRVSSYAPPAGPLGAVATSNAVAMRFVGNPILIATVNDGTARYILSGLGTRCCESGMRWALQTRQATALAPVSTPHVTPHCAACTLPRPVSALVGVKGYSFFSIPHPLSRLALSIQHPPPPCSSELSLSLPMQAWWCQPM